MKKIVIIPAYNEISNIRTTVQDILDHAPGFDYVIINDCARMARCGSARSRA